MKLRLLFLLCVVFSACSHSNKAGFTTYDVDFANPLEASQLIRGKKSLVLRTPDDCPIGRIEKAVVAGNSIFITDESRESVIEFSLSDGSMLSHTGRKGRGPGEYSTITDFDVNEGYVYILCSSICKVLKYKSGGQFIEGYDLGDWYFSVKCDPKRNMLYLSGQNSSRDNYNIISYDLDAKAITGHYDPFRNYHGYVVSSYHPLGFRNEQDCCFSKIFDTRIYGIEEGLATSLFAVNPVGLEYVPENRLKDYDTENIQKEYSGKDYFKFFDMPSIDGNEFRCIAVRTMKIFRFSYLVNINLKNGRSKVICLTSKDDNYPELLSSSVLALSDGLLVTEYFDNTSTDSIINLYTLK